MKSSEYINQERRDYSLYVLEQRAIPLAADGLRSAARRVLWMARDGKKCKSFTLAGMVAPLHPHAAPTGAIDTLAEPYTNNIPLFKGYGIFGTRLKPTACGAPRYTEVKASAFTKDVVFRDIEVIPEKENYDGTLMEPQHFLPLIPIALLNPQSGIAVGFASTILPRSLPNIIKAQLAVLEEKAVVFEEPPELTPTNQKSIGWIDTPKGFKAVFEGSFKRTGATSVKVTNLPYGLLHEKYRGKLDTMEDKGIIIEYTDRSKKEYNIDIKFKRGVLSKLDDDGILKLLDLTTSISENLNVINFDGKTIWNTTFTELVTEFCEWRLGWYKIRYQRLADLLEIDIQRYRDILLAIKKKVGLHAASINSRAELKEFLKEIGIVYVDYIADLAIYRFTLEEKAKIEAKLKEALPTMAEYRTLLKSKTKRQDVYIAELKDVLSKYKRGYYGN